ncbi:hypothetical protein AWG47_15455 [Escherichia coli]|nr:hypothetical protein [Escherichia coli]KZG96633.1 hypothetical protein AWG47_15455 [Escherichia coli]RXB14243.1 hypothetical protein EPT02_25415 [Escherichia coli]
MEVIAENTLRNSYEKRLKKISNSIRFYMLFGSVAMTNCCMCRGECTRKHQNHPERQNDYASNQETDALKRVQVFLYKNEKFTGCISGTL